MIFRRALLLSPPLRLAFAGLLLLVLAGRMLAMPGWMPTITQETLTVTLCSGVSVETVDIRFDRDHDPDKQVPAHDKPCLYAAAHDSGSPPPILAPNRTIWLTAFSYHVPALPSGTAQGGTRLPPATGPPLA